MTCCAKRASPPAISWSSRSQARRRSSTRRTPKSYEQTLAALGDATAARAADAIDAINEASRIANTNVAPAATLGWLQVQLRSL